MIRIRSNAKPFALTTPWCVAVPLLPKIKLQLMEEMGVISKVEEPMEWCTRMIVVPKPNWNVWICVNLTKVFAEKDTSYPQLNRLSLKSEDVRISLSFIPTPDFGRSNLLQHHSATSQKSMDLPTSPAAQDTLKQMEQQKEQSRQRRSYLTKTKTHALPYGVLFVSKFITSGHLENTGGIYEYSGHLHKL